MDRHRRESPRIDPGPPCFFGDVCGDNHVSTEHLGRYLSEFDFRYSTRKMSDAARMERLVGQVHGKRLTYKRVTA